MVAQRYAFLWSHVQNRQTRAVPPDERLIELKRNDFFSNLVEHLWRNAIINGTVFVFHGKRESKIEFQQEIIAKGRMGSGCNGFTRLNLENRQRHGGFAQVGLLLNFPEPWEWAERVPKVGVNLSF